MHTTERLLGCARPWRSASRTAQEDMRKVEESIARLQGAVSRNGAGSSLGRQAAAKLQGAQRQLQRLQGAHAGAVAEADRTKRRRQFEGKF